ncbi:hypothetical protein PG988_006547 [Apiospora saccharicola]
MITDGSAARHCANSSIKTVAVLATNATKSCEFTGLNETRLGPAQHVVSRRADFLHGGTGEDMDGERRELPIPSRGPLQCHPLTDPCITISPFVARHK